MREGITVKVSTDDRARLEAIAADPNSCQKHAWRTRIILATAHLDNHPENNRPRNLRSLCQRCHMIHDRNYHLAQRWITYRRRLAFGDLFLGPYPALIAALASKRPAAQLRTA